MLLSMQDFLSSLLSSIIYGEITSKTKKEERFLNKKKTRETVKKYQLPAGIIAYSFSLLLLLLIAAAIFQSKGQPITALFLGSLYVLMLDGRQSCPAAAFPFLNRPVKSG